MLVNKQAGFAAILALGLGACGSGDHSPSALSDPSIPVAHTIDPAKITNEPRRLAKKGVSALDEEDFEAAEKAFNQALHLDLTNSTLNFLVGLTYHLQGLQGDDKKLALAEEGYKLAIKFDRSNWNAHFQSGLLAMDRRDFALAQQRFAEALIYNAFDQDLLYSMLVASYYSGDVATSSVMVSRLQGLEPDTPRVLRAVVMTEAARDNTDQALSHLDQLAALDGQETQITPLKQRIADWRLFHHRYNQLAQAETEPESEDTEESEQSSDSSDQESASVPIDENGMVITDVVIVRTEENLTTGKGVNLLNGLTLQFGGADSEDAAGPGFSVLSNRTKTVGNVLRTITKAINIPSITYSLNIANVNDIRNEILARPTLTATNGAKSEFFSGVNIKAATMPSTAGGTGEAVSFEDTIGVRLGITPTLLDDGRVKLEVEAERKFLNAPSSSYTGFTSKLEATQTTVTATVVMNFGETLILSGLSERETESTSDGVPLLRDIPIVQYLFNRRTSTDFTKSVLLLITPRQPFYTYKPNTGKDRNARENSSLNELRARYKYWFQPYPSIASIFSHMQDNRLYREFRTGDVTMERWESDSSLKERLKRALGFLYY